MAVDLSDRIEHGDLVRIRRPLTVSTLHGRVVTVSHGARRPYGVQLRDRTHLTLASDEVEWERSDR